jgi:hypothetical protein
MGSLGEVIEISTSIRAVAVALRWCEAAVKCVLLYGRGFRSLRPAIGHGAPFRLTIPNLSAQESLSWH